MLAQVSLLPGTHGYVLLLCNARCFGRALVVEGCHQVDGVATLNFLKVRLRSQNDMRHHCC